MASRGPRDPWDPQFMTRSPKFAAFALLPLDFTGWESWPALDVYDRLADQMGVKTGTGIGVSFVPAAPKPRGRKRKCQSQGLPYEHRIWEKGEVSTRIEIWHDFFNMLAWCLFPKTKAALNARQANLLVGARNAEQNLLCMVDEGGVFAVEDEDGIRSGLIYFGHAIHEAIMRNERGSEGLVIRLMIPAWDGMTSRGLAQVDQLAAELILGQKLRRDPPPDGRLSESAKA